MLRSFADIVAPVHSEVVEFVVSEDAVELFPDEEPVEKLEDSVLESIAASLEEIDSEAAGVMLSLEVKVLFER